MTYIELNDDLIKEIEKYTVTNYYIKGDFLPTDSVISLLEDLISEIHRQEEKVEDLEKSQYDFDW